MDLADFARGIATIRTGEPREKMRFCFDMYDLDKSGEIDVHEVHAMLHEGHRDLWEQVSHAASLPRHCDVADTSLRRH